MRRGIILALFAGSGAAQTIVDPALLPEALREFRPDPAKGSVPCTVDPVRPMLNFAFRFQTGYVLRLPLDLSKGAKQHVDMVLRVTPAGGAPYYFQDAVDFPAAPPHANGQVRGVFLLGEGHYAVKWMLTDEQGRVCRKDWQLDARATHNEHVMIPAGTVGDFSWHAPSPSPSADDAGAWPRRLTILLDAALPPSTRGRGAGSARQWGTLLSMAASLVERLPRASVRLVVFNLDQQKELLREDPFGLSGMNRVAHTADGTQQWTVDYRVLQNPQGAWDLLAGLVNGEMQAADRADAVVFLGLPWRTTVKMPAAFPSAAAEGMPRFLYLQFRTGMLVRPTGMDEPGRMGRGQGGGGGRGGGRQPQSGVFMGPSESPDAVDRTVRRMKGKALTIFTPGDFEKAIQEIERRPK